MLWIDTSITLNIGAEGDREYALRFAGSYIPARRGHRDFGAPVEPPEPADFILTHIDINIDGAWQHFPTLLLTAGLLADLHAIGLAAHAPTPPNTVSAAWATLRRVAA